LPPELGAALTAAESLLRVHDERMADLSGTDHQLRQLLEAKVRATVAGNAAELTRITKEREDASCRRAGLLNELLDAEAELTGARDTVQRARVPYVAAAVAEFQRRFESAREQFAAVLSEGQSLAHALGESITMDLAPIVRAEKPWGHIPPAAERPIWFRPEIDESCFDRPLKLTPTVPPADVPLSPEAERLSAITAALADALAVSASVRNYNGLVNQFAGRRIEAKGFDPQAVYRVLRPITDPLNGHEFPAGTLVDTTLVPAPLLVRAFSTRRIAIAA
jgi:hypothetical protein